MRRTIPVANEIFKMSSMRQRGTEGTIQQSALEGPSVMVQYTWSAFFQQSLAFSKSMVAAGIPERAVVTIQGFNSPEHFMSIMGTVCANCIFSDQYMTNSA